MSTFYQIPAQWSKRRLRFDANLNPLKSRLDLAADTEVSFVPMDAVGEFGSLTLKETRPLQDVYNGYTYFENGDVVVAKITPCFENGKGALAQGLTNGIAFGTTELHVIRPLSGLDARFLFYLTIAHDFRSFGEAEMLGAGGQKRVPEEFLKNWRAPLPSIEIQRRIACFLDEKTARIDGLVEKKRALLDRLAEKRRALIIRAVTKGLNPDAAMKPSGVDWLGDIPAHWEVKQLRRVRRYMTSGSRDWAAYYSNEGDPFLRMTNVTGQGIELNLDDLRFVSLEAVNEGTRTSVLEGDILITITAELGSVAIVRKNIKGAYINQHLALFRPNQAFCSSEFLVNFLSTDIAHAQFMVSGQGGTKQGLGFEQINNVVLGFPPREEQESIARFCAELWQKFQAAERSLSLIVGRLAEYREALINAAVMGKLEVA